MHTPIAEPVKHFVRRDDLQVLVDALRARRLRVVGPTFRDGAIVLDEISRIEELPAGLSDEQAPGSYRVRERADRALFGHAVGPHAWKRFLNPPRLRLWRAERSDSGITFQEEVSEEPRLAFFGIRACDIKALASQDGVFLAGPVADPHYTSRRGGLFTVAVHCTEPGGNCFCASMGAGPAARDGFDLALTEIVDAARHHFIVEAGSAAGREVLDDVPHRAATPAEMELAAQRLRESAGRMGRRLDTAGLKEVLEANLEHPRWGEVAARCLACANCTMVCPTCFCTSVEETTDLTGRRAERWRRWDSCFSLEFSYIHGGSVRASGLSRYRQWMTHKLATWSDQFATAGCVGCGRCITWCPAAIDITEEARAIRESDGQPAAARHETEANK